MPKMKTNRTAYKKYRVGGTGTVKRAQAFTSHNTAKKTGKQLRQLRGSVTVDASNEPAVRGLLPYSKRS